MRSSWGHSVQCSTMFPFDPCSCSKLGPKHQGQGSMEAALHSLSQLDLGYIDLYLIHWPGTQGLQVSDQRNPGLEVNCVFALHLFPVKQWCYWCYRKHVLFADSLAIAIAITRQQSQELGFTGRVACSGKAEGHWCIQLQACTHERTNAELQDSSCAATGMYVQVI